jgi:hypothetical protein
MDYSSYKDKKSKMRKINFIPIVIFLAIIPLISAQTLKENSQTIDTDYIIGINQSGYDAGQYFYAQSSYTLKKISVYQWIGGGGNPSCDYEVDIYRTNETGSPVYLLATNFTYSQTDFLIDDTAMWRNISFPDIQINAGETYGIFFFELNNNTCINLRWWADANIDTYSNGNAVVNTGTNGETGGSWWQSQDTSFAYFYDYSFIVWGEETQIQDYTIKNIFISSGQGLGAFLDSIRNPSINLVINILVVSIILVIFLSLILWIKTIFLNYKR